ncbi:DUF6668 family protein [Isoptericola sp. F-RaC21]|uniref:DUF6668 family protein n=1 Tax=Isoptericola sp. F-RaC21 TaxID=3141452 RepID=UPI00315BDFCD
MSLRDKWSKKDTTAAGALSAGWIAAGTPAEAAEETAAPAPPAAAESSTTPDALMAAHGGCGVTALSTLTRLPELKRDAAPDDRVAVVARSHLTGLHEAQNLIRGLDDLGIVVTHLVVVADAPGRLPKPLAHLLEVLTGAAPVLWVPWVEAWRLAPATPSNTPKSVMKALGALNPATAPAADAEATGTSPA